MGNCGCCTVRTPNFCFSNGDAKGTDGGYVYGKVRQSKQYQDARCL